MARNRCERPYDAIFASRFKWLSRFRLRETICTDTIVSVVKTFLVLCTCGSSLLQTRNRIWWMYTAWDLNPEYLWLTRTSCMKKAFLPVCTTMGCFEQHQWQRDQVCVENMWLKMAEPETSESHRDTLISWLKKTSQLMDRVGLGMLWLHLYDIRCSGQQLLPTNCRITPFQKRHGYTPDI
jgi:hypothetical protein